MNGESTEQICIYVLRILRAGDCENQVHGPVKTGTVSPDLLQKHQSYQRSKNMVNTEY